MKNKLFILFFLVLSSTLIFGQSIEVTNPGSKTVLMNGQTLKITWNKIGKQVDFVKIRLFNSKGTQKILGITEKAKNSGLFRWTFTGNVPDGQYIIKVKTKDDKVAGNSKVFRIGKGGSVPPPPPPPDPPPPPPPPPPGNKSLDITYPNGGETLSKNFPSKITWKVTGLTGNINLELWKGNKKYRTIANNISVSHKLFKWTLGNAFGNVQADEGKDYRIRIAGSGIDDISDRYFSISDIPGIVDNQNSNMINNIHTFKNPPQQTVTLAISPVIEEIKIWSKDPKFRGQVKHGDLFDIKVRLKNNTKVTDKNDWTIEAYLDNKIFLKKTLKNSTSPKKPGKSWWFVMANATTERLPNKSGFHILKVVLGNSSKSTMMGILETDHVIIPDIRNYKIWNNDCKCWSNRAKYKKSHWVKLKYDVVNAVRITFTNLSTNQVEKTIYLPNRWGKGEFEYPCYYSGKIRMTAFSASANFKSADIYLDTTDPLQVGGKILDFEMWRVNRNIKTRGFVQGYRLIMFFEVYDNGKERLLKKLETDTFKSSRLDWEFQQVTFPINLKLQVTYLDYSQVVKTRTFN